MFKILAAALGLYSYLLIETSLPQLPSRIPTHFNLAGQPDGWGSPRILWVMLGIQVLTAGLMLFIPFLGRRFPGSVHFGSRRLSDFTPEQRERVAPLLEQMAGCMSAAVSIFFVYIIREMVRTAEQPDSRARIGWATGLFVAGLAGLAIHFVRRMSQAVKAVEPADSGLR